MTRTLAIALTCLTLAACESEADRKASYMAFCTTHEFTAPQCEVLYLNKRASDAAAMNAAAVQISSSAAIGMAAGARR